LELPFYHYGQLDFSLQQERLLLIKEKKPEGFLKLIIQKSDSGLQRLPLTEVF
jgi:hypothetical protein